MRTIAFIALSIMVCSSVFAIDVNSATTSMEVSAYKESTAYPSSTSIKIYSYESSSTELSSVLNSYDVSDEFDESTSTLSKAFTVMLASNELAGLSVELILGPLVNQDDRTDIVDVSYNFTSSSLSTVTSSTVSIGSGRNAKSYQFRYSPSLTLYYPSSSDTSVSTINVTESGTSALLVLDTTGTIYYRTKSGRKWGSYSELTDTSIISDYTTLPGYSSDITAYGYFEIDLDDNYTDLEANTDYVATVGVVITSTT